MIHMWAAGAGAGDSNQRECLGSQDLRAAEPEECCWGINLLGVPPRGSGHNSDRNLQGAAAIVRPDDDDACLRQACRGRCKGCGVSARFDGSATATVADPSHLIAVADPSTLAGCVRAGYRVHRSQPPQSVQGALASAPDSPSGLCLGFP